MLPENQMLRLMNTKTLPIMESVLRAVWLAVVRPHSD